MSESKKEIARLEKMLADTCKILAHMGTLYLMPAEIRDWYGAYRARVRGKSPAGSECFKT